MYENQIAFKNHDRGIEVAKKLLEEEYVVMLSYEENLLIVNWEWCEAPQADRNCVVFMPRYKYEEELDEVYKEAYNAGIEARGVGTIQR